MRWMPAGMIVCVAWAALALGQEAWREEGFAIEKVGERAAWAGAAVEPGKWKPVAQDDLAERIKAAGELKILDVAPPPERCWVGHQPYLVPNADGASWDSLLPYYNTYGGEQEVVIHDFGTGKTLKQVLSTRKGESVLTRESIDFHMQPSYYADGKLLFAMYGRVLFLIYDPAADAFVYGAKPFGDDVINGQCVLGKDGALYGLGWPRDKSGFVAYRFDPRTREAKRFDAFGPANPNRTELYREVVMFGDWLYAAIGNRPWHLAAFNFKTGQGRLLATTKDILGSGDTIRIARLTGGLSATVSEAVSIDGLDDFDRAKAEVWLHEGKVYRRSGDIPPWSDAADRPAPRKSFGWAREFQQWPEDFTPPSPPPLFKPDAAAPDGKGHVELPYRLSGKSDWQTLAYDVRMYGGEVRLLSEINDHVLFVTDSGYGQHVFYDLAARRMLRVGGTLSPYSAGLVGGRLYVAGYPSSQMYEYDFSRPIGLRQPQPNPRKVATIAEKDDTHCPLAGTVGGADGRVYCAGTTYGRRREGGGFGWYDPRTGEIGGMPLEGHRIFWMAAAGEGRYILLSSKLGEGGELFCWDTRAGAMIYQKKLLGGDRPGPIVEALPGGLVIGHHGTGVLYGLRAETGEVLWTKPMPAAPVTAVSPVQKMAWCFRRGADGHIWTFLDDVLVRIDPRDARVEPVGRLPRGIQPGQLAFAGGKVYLAGGKRLVRVEVPGATNTTTK